MTADDETLIAHLAIRHSVSAEAVRTVLHALRSGGLAIDATWPLL